MGVVGVILDLLRLLDMGQLTQGVVVVMALAQVKQEVCHLSKRQAPGYAYYSDSSRPSFLFLNFFLKNLNTTLFPFITCFADQ